MAIDKKKIEEHIKGILIALGDNPDREGLRETPKRVAEMYAEVFEGMNYTNDELVTMFQKTFQEEQVAENGKDMVLMKDIEIMSHCEHHLALMYNMKVSIAYIPNKKVIGLSKIARIADMVGRRLQLQERIGTDILEVMKKITESEDVAVLIEGEHGCMTFRGIKKMNAKTVTTTLSGKFETDPVLYQKFITLAK